MKSHRLTIEEILERYKGHIWGYCLEVTGNEHDANDLQQMVLLRLENAIDKVGLRSGADIKKLINQHLRWQALTWNQELRSQGLKIERLAQEEAAMVADAVSQMLPGSKGLNRKELMRELARNLIEDLKNGRRVGGITEREHKVFVMHALQGMTQKEIAAELGNSRGAVAKTYWEAKTKIRKWLARKRDEDDDDIPPPFGGGGDGGESV